MRSTMMVLSAVSLAAAIDCMLRLRLVGFLLIYLGRGSETGRSVVNDHCEFIVEECEQCGGDGVYGHDCGEDCCACLYPEENRPCDVCNGSGWIRADFDKARE